MLKSLSMPLRGQLYLADIASRWRKEAHSDVPHIFLVSPYITGLVIQTLSKVPKGAANVYTCFDAELFIQRASDLGALRRCIENGHRVFHLPRLHAKIVLVPGVFASVGSQNITHGGTRNKEASVALTDPTSLRRIEKKLMAWARDSEPVTIAQIEDMQEAVTAAEVSVKKARAAIKSANEHVRDRHREREEQARKLLEIYAARERELHLRSLSRALATAPQSSDRVNATLVATGEFHGLRSLVAPSGRTFTDWTLDGQEVHLRKTERYLCVVPRFGWIGWARVVKTRITFVSSGLEREVEFAGETLRAVFSAHWSFEAERAINVTVTVKNPRDGARVVLDLSFSLNDIIVVTPGSTSADSVKSQSDITLSRRIESDWLEFKEELLAAMLTPFRYSTALRGNQAHDFFWGEVGSIHQVRLARIQGYPVLVAEALT